MGDGNSTTRVTVDLQTEKARQELKELEKITSTLKKQRIEATAAGDQNKLKQVNIAIAEANTKMKTLRTTSQNVDYTMSHLSTAGIKEINATIKSINARLRSGAVERNSSEWRVLNQQLKECKTELRSIKDESKESESIFSQIGNGVNKYAASIASAVAAVTGLSMTIKKCTSDYAQMDDVMTNTTKYTGQTKEEVEAMNEDFKNMDTRTSREQLNDLAGVAGRLGITGKQAIEEFVNGADTINVALGDDLGEGAVDKIGKLAQMFGEDKTKGLRGAMLATGSAVNDLAQSSSANAGYIVDFTADLSGVGVQAKMSQAQIMGLASALDQNMQEESTASTVFSQLITKMYQDPARFAKIAGMQVKEFTNLMKTDANGGLIKFLEAMKSRGGFDAMAPLFQEMKLDGTRAVGVLSAVATHIDQVKVAQQTAAASYAAGTSVVKEFNTQNSSVQAQLDKAKKKFQDLSIELGQKLMPIAKYAISATSLGVKALSLISTWLINNISLIARICVVIAAYYTAVGISIAIEKRNVAVKALSLALDKAEVTWLAIKKTAVLATAVVYNTLTGNLEKAKKAQEALNLVTKMNPWGLAAAAIAAVIVVVTSLVKHYNNLKKQQLTQLQAVKDYENAQKEASNKTANQISKIKLLTSIIHDNTRSIDDRRAAILTLSKIVPGYIAKIDKEGRVIGETTNKIKDYINNLEKAAIAQAVTDKLTTLESGNIDLSQSDLRRKTGLKKRQNRLSLWMSNHQNIASDVDKLSGMNRGAINLYAEQRFMNSGDLMDSIKEYRILKADVDEAQNWVDQSTARLSNQQRRITNLKNTAKHNKINLVKAISDTVSPSVESDNNPLPSRTGTNSNTTGGGSNNENDKLNKKREIEIQYLEDEISDEKHIIEMSHNEGIIEEEEYGNKINELKIKELQEKLNIENKYGTQEQRNTAKRALEDEQNSQAEQAVKKEHDKKIAEEKKLQEDIQHIKDEYLQLTIDERFATEMKALNALHDASLKYEKEHQGQVLMSEEDYEKASLAIKQKYKDLKDKEDKENGNGKDDKKDNSLHGNEIGGLAGELVNFFDVLENSSEKGWDGFIKKARAAISVAESAMGDLSNYYSACSEQEVAETQAKYEKQITAAGENTKKGKKLKEKEEKEIAKIKTKYAKREASMQIAQIIANTAIAAMAAYTSAIRGMPYPANMVLAPIAAGLAVAAGAVQIATVKKQAQAQQAGYYLGGFTSGSQYHEEAGVVHQGEFVANHQAVNNPNVLPILRLIDQAQRSNTVGRLTSQDIAHNLGGSAAPVVAPIVNIDNNSAEVAQSVSDMKTATQRLNEHLDNGIVAVVSIDGRDGVAQKMKEYNRLLKNK